VTKISTDQAEALLDEGATFVDVRTPEEFAEGHVPGALNVPISFAAPGGMKPNDEFLEVMSRAFAKDQKLIISCKAGGRSARATSVLEQAGFSKLYDMTAGFVGSRDAFGHPIAGWQAEGREVEIDAEADRTYAGVRRLSGLKSE
jgi:rhodanese-related sulfurtransferase